MKELSEYQQRIGKSRHIEVLVVCEHCGTDFWTKWSRVKIGQGRFCSLSCYNDVQKESLPSDSVVYGKENAHKYLSGKGYKVFWIDVISNKRVSTTYAKWWWEVNRGEIPAGYRASYKDENPLNIDPDNIILISSKEFGQRLSKNSKGRVISEETKRKMSKAAQEKSLSVEHKKKIGDHSRKLWNEGFFDSIHKGENSSHWRGGIDNKYPQEFSYHLKETVKERDHYCCQCCGKSVYRSRHGQIHHISGDRSDNSFDNLILLCSSCHSKVHNSVVTESECIMTFRSMLYWNRY